jgi:predicted RNA-binding protein with PUA-like domain
MTVFSAPPCESLPLGQEGRNVAIATRKTLLMARWLFKEEPEHYSYADLERDGKTVWSGVNNPVARNNLRQIKPGDRILYYHTGKEKAIVGEMRAASAPSPDPKGRDAKAVLVEVEPVRRWAKPVTLSQVKADKYFENWELVRMPRLSVMPVSEDQWKRLEEMSRG